MPLLLLAGPALAAAQEPIETDRDSFTPSTVSARRGRLILESSYSLIDNRDQPETHSFPELLARYGVADGLELRLGANYEIGGAANSISGGGGDGDFTSAEIESEANVSYGVKARLTEQDGWLPRSVAIVAGNTPTSGHETRTHVVATYAWGWELTERVVWDFATRYGDGAVEEAEFHRWAPSTVVKVELAEAWTGHVEYFGIYTDGRADELSQSYLSPGIHYLLTPDLEIGVRAGWGLSDDAANFFSNVGVGLQF